MNDPGRIERLHAYLDGELDAHERALLERELARDASLRAELERLRSVDAAIGLLPGCDAPRDLGTAALRRARRRRRGRILAIVAPLAAAAAVAVAVLLPRDREADAPQPVFDQTVALHYAWEADGETYGSLALSDLEDEVMEVVLADR